MEKIKSLAQELCHREGYKLYDLEYVLGDRVLRVYIDKKEGGVTLDDCTHFSQGFSFLLDSENPIEENYNLEVSSPGLERLLTQNWHYEEQVGKKIKAIIKAHSETSEKLKTKKLEGFLEKVEKNSFFLRVDEAHGRHGGKTYELPFSDIHRCNLVFEDF